MILQMDLCFSISFTKCSKTLREKTTAHKYLLLSADLKQPIKYRHDCNEVFELAPDYS